MRVREWVCEQVKESKRTTRNKMYRKGDESLCTNEKAILIGYKSSTKHNGLSGLYIQVLKGLPH